MTTVTQEEESGKKGRQERERKREGPLTNTSGAHSKSVTQSNMKLSAVIIVISVFISMALTALMYLKREDEAAIAKKASVMDIKVRVTRDVMGEYQIEAEKLQKSLDEGTKVVELLNAAIQIIQNEDKTKNDELAACQNELVRIENGT